MKKSALKNFNMTVRPLYQFTGSGLQAASTETTGTDPTNTTITVLTSTQVHQPVK